jgi:hypothetical protein
MVVTEDVAYMNFSSIQTSLQSIIILRLILWLNNVICIHIVYIYPNFYFLKNIILILK